MYKKAEIAKTVIEYFKNMFTSEQGDRGETVNYALRPIVSHEDNEVLIAVPSAVEIKEAIHDINGEKAPGPDGFSASFYHTHWNEVGPDLVQEIQGS